MSIIKGFDELKPVLQQRSARSLLTVIVLTDIYISKVN